MTTKKLTKLMALYLPYILLGLVATNFGEAWRLAEGKELGDKIMSMMGTIPCQETCRRKALQCCLVPCHKETCTADLCSTEVWKSISYSCLIFSRA